MNENKKYGSATRLNGKTVIVSVFVDDKTTRWEFDKKDEEKRACLVLEKLKIATDWIIEQTGRFGAKTEFIYDWSLENDLFKRAKYDKDMIFKRMDEIEYLGTCCGVKRI